MLPLYLLLFARLGVLYTLIHITYTYTVYTYTYHAITVQELPLLRVFVM